jgi:hypothetical protein
MRTAALHAISADRNSIQIQFIRLARNNGGSLNGSEPISESARCM